MTTATEAWRIAPGLREAVMDVHPNTDEALLGLAKKGDRGALTELVRRHRARVERLAVAVMGDRESARDVAQEGFLRMLRSLEKLDPERGLKGWLDRVVVNLAIDHLRRRKRHDGKEVGMLAEVEAPLAVVVAVAVALPGLPPLPPLPPEPVVPLPPLPPAPPLPPVVVCRSTTSRSRMCRAMAM